MNLQLSGLHIEITPALRDYISQKLNRIKRHFDHVITVNIILSVEKLQNKAEVNVHISGKDICLESRDPNMYAAIDDLIDRLDRQILKHKEKYISNHRA